LYNDAVRRQDYIGLAVGKWNMSKDRSIHGEASPSVNLPTIKSTLTGLEAEAGPQL
jgi:hypothetical protein